MKCPKCRNAKAVKNGILNQKQRYKCKHCGCNYTVSTLSRTPAEKRVKAIKLYLEGAIFKRKIQLNRNSGKLKRLKDCMKKLAN